MYEKVKGVAIMGLNGCGKSTLAHEICKRIGFYEMDLEDYYFPEQKVSRKAILEHQYNVKCDYKGELPYSLPRSKNEVQDMIRADIEKHPQFVLSGVTMNWEEDIISAIDVVFILEVPTAERVKRVQKREEIRFGSRVLIGGDMYEQQRDFSNIIANRPGHLVVESADRINCRKISLDGTKDIEENVNAIMKILDEMNCKKTKRRMNSDLPNRERKF